MGSTLLAKFQQITIIWFGVEDLSLNFKSSFFFLLINKNSSCQIKWVGILMHIDSICLMYLTLNSMFYIYTIRSTQCCSNSQTTGFASDSWGWSLFVRKWSFKPHGGPDWSLVAVPAKGSFIFSSWTTGRRKGGQFYLARYVGMMTWAQWSVNRVWRGWCSSIRWTLLGVKSELKRENSQWSSDRGPTAGQPQEWIISRGEEVLRNS